VRSFANNSKKSVANGCDANDFVLVSDVSTELFGIPTRYDSPFLARPWEAFKYWSFAAASSGTEL